MVAMLPVVTRLSPHLIALMTNDKNHADRHTCRGDDENENSTAQGLDHSSASGRCLRVTERATLRESWQGSGKQQQCDQRIRHKRQRSRGSHLRLCFCSRHAFLPAQNSTVITWNRVPRRPACGSCRSIHIASPAEPRP